MATPSDSKLRTLNGTAVILYNLDAGGRYPLHGAYWSGEEWLVTCWKSNGKKFDWTEEPHPLDIVNMDDYNEEQ